MSAVLLNGQPAGAEDLRALALINYGHFTSMQVRDRSVQGLELHRKRLEAATRELFGAELDFPSVREQMRRAIADYPDCTLRATAFSRSFDYRNPAGSFAPEVLISVSPPSPARTGSLRVKSFPFQRSVPHIKHVGTFPLFHYRRLALGRGFDDALFADAAGAVSEGSIWNIGFWGGQQVVWPNAPALRGTSEQLVQSGLRELGVAQAVREVRLQELMDFQVAFACNASGIQLIASVDETAFKDGAKLLELLEEALRSSPWQAI
ncbi:MAG TPA: aminotransferase class IV family protein [Pseudoxanthomonas sp.]